MKKIIYTLAKLLNRLLPKEKNSIFAEPHKNGKKDCQDIINYSGDSVLTFLHYLMKLEEFPKYRIYLVIYNEERVNQILQYLSNNQISNISILQHYSCYTGVHRFTQKVRYELRKMRSRVWMSATVHAHKRYAIKDQKLICLNYCSSFKKDYNDLPFDYLPKNWSLVCSTSVLDSAAQSAAFAIPYHCFQPLGLARNDVLFHRTEKELIIRKWLNQKANKPFSKIIIYAPTFRDYEKSETTARNIWGYDSHERIVQAICESDAVVIAKMHSRQNLDVISCQNANVVFYEPCYDFTIYDIMTIADLMITDYSSIGLDFLLIDKPVIYSLYDEEKYMQTRGMCIEPIEEICGGEIVRDEGALAESIRRCLQPGYTYSEKQRVRKLCFKYLDGSTCERVYNYLLEEKVL